jgi:hypothetical protein
MSAEMLGVTYHCCITDVNGILKHLVSMAIHVMTLCI